MVGIACGGICGGGKVRIGITHTAENSGLIPVENPVPASRRHRGRDKRYIGHGQPDATTHNANQFAIGINFGFAALAQADRNQWLIIASAVVPDQRKAVFGGVKVHDLGNGVFHKVGTEDKDISPCATRGHVARAQHEGIIALTAKQVVGFLIVGAGDDIIAIAAI